MDREIVVDKYVVSMYIYHQALPSNVTLEATIIPRAQILVSKYHPPIK